MTFISTDDQPRARDIDKSLRCLNLLQWGGDGRRACEDGRQGRGAKWKHVHTNRCMKCISVSFREEQAGGKGGANIMKDATAQNVSHFHNDFHACSSIHSVQHHNQFSGLSTTTTPQGPSLHVYAAYLPVLKKRLQNTCRCPPLARACRSSCRCSRRPTSAPLCCRCHVWDRWWS